MGFQDVVFLPPCWSYTTYLKNCCRGESPGTTTCQKNLVRGKQGHAPVKYFRPNKASFVSVECHGNGRIAINMM